MTDTSGTPQELLSSTNDLTRRVREAQRGAGFPLLLFGALTLLAIPFARYGHYLTTCAANRNGVLRTCTHYSVTSFVYWPVALVLAYVAITAFYVRRSRSRGVGSRIRPYVIAGVILAVLLTGAALWAAHHPITETDVLGLHLQARSSLTTAFYRLAGPGAAIGLALLVLARVERSAALLVFAVGYLAIVLSSINLGWVVTPPSPWGFLPHLVITGGVLLLGGLGFALAQRPTP